MKKVTELSHKEAAEFFFRNESYCNFDLPNYLNFTPLLKSISDFIGGHSLKDLCLGASNPCHFDDVNYQIFTNKDGKHAWRLLQLIHPVFYVLYVKNLTEKDEWNHIQNIFEEFHEKSLVKCLSLPIASDNENSNKANQVRMWLENIEKQSLCLSLDYEFLMNTDIADCYGSIYTHSIPWALHTKEVSKRTRGMTLLGIPGTHD